LAALQTSAYVDLRSEKYKMQEIKQKFHPSNTKWEQCQNTVANRSKKKNVNLNLKIIFSFTNVVVKF
jgi:hypothetical protein